MRPKLLKDQKQSLKLPSIGNKTMGDIYKQTAKQKQRPLSSKNIVTNLQKKLFSQLQTYDQKCSTVKLQKTTNKHKSKTNSTIISNSCKQIVNNGKTYESQSMQKIAQLMPQLYSKIMQSKKYDEIKPLKQTFMFMNQQNGSRQLSQTMNMENKNIQTKKSSNNKNENNPINNHNSINSTTTTTAHSISSMSMGGITSSRIKQPKKIEMEIQKKSNKQTSIKPTERHSQKRNQHQDKIQSTTTTTSKNNNHNNNSSQIQSQDLYPSSDNLHLGNFQIDRIFKEYMQSQGMQQPQTSSSQLAQMNIDLNKCQADIQQLEKNYSKLIRQLGNLCVDEVD